MPLEFDSDWIQQYRKNVEKLKRLGLSGVLAIYHIGSTSIKMKASPIIDIMMVYRTTMESELAVTLLIANGFENRGDRGVPGLTLLTRPPMSTSLQLNLYILEDGNPNIARYILFRNYLRQNSGAVIEYENILQQTDEYSLNKNKQRFIKHVLNMALNKIGGEALPHWVTSTVNNFQNDMTDSQLKLAVINNLIFEMTFHSYFVDNCDLFRVNNMNIIVSETDSELFNYCISRSEIENVADIQEVLEIFHEKNKLRFSWWLCTDRGSYSSQPSELSERLHKLDIELKDTQIGMILDLLDSPRSYSAASNRPVSSSPSSSSSLMIIPVRTYEQFRLFDEVHVQVGVTSGAYTSIYSKIPQRFLESDAPTQCFLGCIRNSPVVTGMVVFYSGIAGIYYTVTSPEHRQNGYGTTMMTHIISAVRERGYRYMALITNDSGQQFYKSLGYQPICFFQRYAPNNS